MKLLPFGAVQDLMSYFLTRSGTLLCGVPCAGSRKRSPRLHFEEGNVSSAVTSWQDSYLTVWIA